MLSSLFTLFFISTLLLLFLAFFYKADKDLQILFALLGFVMSVITTYASLNIEVVYVTDEIYRSTSIDWAYFGMGLIMSLALLFQSLILIWSKVVRMGSVDHDHFGFDIWV